MAKSNKIEVKGLLINVVEIDQKDYISLTDIARFKDAEHTDAIFQNWIRNRNTVELLGLWEQLNNSDFKSIKFDAFKNESGSNSFALTKDCHNHKGFTN